MPTTQSKFIAYIGLGSNLGDRLDTLETAVEKISALPKTLFLRRSDWFESEAVGDAATLDFINAVAEVETSMPPAELMKALLAIETELGRQRLVKWGDRTCDLDLLIYGELISTDADCTLPHPGIPDRRFVLEPLAQLAPDLVLPGIDISVKKALKDCRDPHWVRLLDD